MECLANYLECTIDDLLDKIEDYVVLTMNELFKRDVTIKYKSRYKVPKKNQETVNPGAENISINTGIEDKPTEEPKEDENENGDESGDETIDYDLENESNRNGSAEYPYIIYSAENFNSLISSLGGKQRIVTTPLTEEVVDEEVLDEEENKTYDVNHFELVNDIDFADVEYTTLFNNDEAFIGVIDGKGYAIKNISINVNENNFEEKFSFVKDGNRYARVALFGEMKGAVIKNLKKAKEMMLVVRSFNLSIDEQVASKISVYKEGSGCKK